MPDDTWSIQGSHVVYPLAGGDAEAMSVAGTVQVFEGATR
jgi:hypothetical protein